MAKLWTEEYISLLKAYFENPNLSYADIAKKMTKVMKRNMSGGSIEKAGIRYGLKKTDKIPFRKEKKQTIDPNINILQQLDDTKFEELKNKSRIKWDIKKTKVKANKNRPFKSYLIVADMHVPEQNIKAVKSILKLMDDVKFDGFINLGDFMDFGCISHWNSTKKLTSEGMKLKEDYIIGNGILDEFDKRLPKGCDKHHLFGNHEDWYNQFIEFNPVLEGMLHPTKELKLIERGYNVLETYNDTLKIGQLTFTHGIYAGMHYVKKHIDECKTNIMFGHLHSGRMRFESSPVKQLAIAGYCLGCLCDLSPGYMKNRPNKWTHGFAVVNFFDNGDFDVDLKRIVRGKFIYNNKVYDGSV